MKRNNVKQQVLAGLKAEEANRNSDISLMIWIWENFYNTTEENFTFAKLYNLPTQELVKRYRAKIQNEEKLYLPTNERVKRGRNKNQSKMRVSLGYGSIYDYINQ